MRIRQESVKKSYGKLEGRVMFPSSHDLFDFPRFKEACFLVLTKLLESGNDVLVTTKPRLPMVQEIHNCFDRHREQLQFRFTITSLNDQLLEFWEPNAPRFGERMESLRYAFENGYRTSVSIEPFLDYDPSSLAQTVTPYSTESVWIGRMNHIPREVPGTEGAFFADVRSNYETEHLKDIHNELKDVPKIRFKDSIRNQLGVQ
jgi:DNA repair photolyase